MATETVTNYETVEREQQVFICDNCGSRYDSESELVEMHYYIGDETSIPKYDICDDCSNAISVVEAEAKNERWRTRLKHFGKWVGHTLTLGLVATFSLFSFAFGMFVPLLLGATATDQENSEWVNSINIGDTGIALVVFVVVCFFVFLVFGTIFLSEVKEY